MSVVLSVEETGTCRKEVTVEVPASAVQAETQKLVRTYSQQASLPGFRRGKAPASIVRKRFRQEIDQQVVEALIPRFWEKAQEEQGLDPLGQPQLKELGDLEDGGPLRFVTVVEVRPEVELGELAPEQFELPEVEVEPSDEDVDAALDDLRRQMGDWNEVDRAAARGDLVTLRIVEEGAEESASGDDAEAGDDAESTDDKPGDAEPADAEPEDEEPGDEVQVEVGDANVWEELSLAISGLEAGQQGRFTRRPPEPQESEGDEAADPPQPRTFNITVKQVQERELPELNDELAQRLGDFETVEDLRKTMADKLRHDRGHERDGKRREAVMEQMRQRYPIPLPEGILHEEAQTRLNDYAQDMASRGMDPRQANIDWEKMGEQFQPHAMRRLHDRLLLDAVAEEQGLEVSEGEVDAAIASVARARGATFQQMQEALGDRRSGLAKQIRREKALKWLMGEEDAAEEAVAAGDAATEDSATEGVSEDGAVEASVTDDAPVGDASSEQSAEAPADDADTEDAAADNDDKS